jgi:iron complex outermembrane recepter protein
MVMLARLHGRRMRRWYRNPPGALVLVILILPTLPVQADPDDEGAIPELVVTSQRHEQPALEHAGNIDRIGAATIEDAGHQHIYELLTRVAGVWLGRGSGQEHLTAIRSPVLTGAGSCGAFLFLEDSIPVRPAGFCNVNGMLEMDTEQARSIEVVRGPGNALYGSNALHGTINVLMPMPDGDFTPEVALEAGANDFYRARLTVPFDAEAPWLAALVYADDGGFRADSGYRQGKLHLKRRRDTTDGAFTLGVSATDLDQQTAGYIIGKDAYKDPAVNRSNANPEAFRKASSERIYGIWTRSLPHFELDLRPYVRRSDMRFLQHFLPGEPLEENGQVSAGAMLTLSFGGDSRRTILGVDTEWSDSYLKETQDGPTEGSPFLVETRPEGKHYDYAVTSIGLAPYVQTDFRLSEQTTLGAGLRLDYLHYNYDNRMLDGNTRDDGTQCGFGGCLYSRPADRNDSFTNIAPNLSLTRLVGDDAAVYVNLARGFRAPQMTELYRLQSGQNVADLGSENVDSIEFGARKRARTLSVDVALYAMQKRDSIYRDAEGYNVSGARSKHRGIETDIDWQIAPAWSLSVDATYARHTYDFDTVAAQGETFVSGRDVDTAPRWLGSAELHYRGSDRFDAALQWTLIGKYFIDAENQFTYPGHSIANLRTRIQLSSDFDVMLRLDNVTDRAVADRADYAFGDYRYFPGRGREFFAELRYRP